MTDYDLTRTRRKTIAIYIRDGNVEVRAPLGASVKEIDRFVLSKEAWIQANLKKQISQTKEREGFAVDYGSEITWRGKMYPIVSRSGNIAGFDGICFYVPTGLTRPQIKAACVQVYRRLALIYLKGRVSCFSGKMGVAPAAVKVNSAKTRWGSCSSKKSINFSWRLALADDDVIDYVVVHELAHLIELNHSERFWAVVKGILPDYANRKIRLRALQERLIRENWDI